MEASIALEVQPRKRPVQERARQRVSRILEATAELLEERGSVGLTTNHIADRAEVNIASLYQYFPNKQAVVMALADRMIHEYQQIYASFPDEFAWAADWRAVYTDYIYRLIVAGTGRKGSLAIRKAIEADPNFVNFDRRVGTGIARFISEGLRRRLSASDMTLPNMLSRTIVATGESIFESDNTGRTLAYRHPEITAEIIKMQIAYLDLHLS
ncbi:MAG: TetR/AcrR family transcriptional regulator [Parvibaculaceae bacterium]|nr:TetR/AcrR family transcriptional regulator [Parvibaculaceae bacterium]